MPAAPAHRRRSLRRRWWPALVAVVAVAGACSNGGADPVAAPTAVADQQVDGSTSTTTTTTTATTAVPAPVDDEVWPTPEWAATTAEEAGLDQAALDGMAAAAERGGSECLVVTRDGELVGEWYWQGFGPTTEREVFSVTKSITATLVGIAQDRGLLDIDEPASTYIEEWRGTPSEGVSIRNLISNDSGRFQDFQTDYIQMAVQAPDKTAFSIGLDQQHPPGTEWVYNNAAIQTLEAVLEEATGEPVGDFAAEALFEPLGMTSTINTDAAGNTLTFMGAQASCRDLARFGLLYLRGGEWDGEQVVSADWVAEATAPSQELNPGYGYLWWLSRDGGTGDGTADGEALEEGADTYAALGLHNQIVGVFPDDDVVVTRLGADRGADGSAFGLGEVAAGVRAALGSPDPAPGADASADQSDPGTA